LGSASRTAAAVLAWIALNELLPTTKTQAVGALRTLGAVVLATAAVYLPVVIFQWRPRLHVRAEYLHDPTSPVGMPVDRSPFPARLTTGSIWFRIYVEYECRGPIARRMAAGMSNAGNALELAFGPANGLLVNAEPANGADVTPLSQGRRGVSVALPSPPPKGAFAVFQVELKPVTAPVALPLVAKVSFVRAPGNGTRRLRMLHTSSDIERVEVLV
jgi:hypothetical protein